jgi:hypothetical protein
VHRQHFLQQVLKVLKDSKVHQELRELKVQQVALRVIPCL